MNIFAVSPKNRLLLLLQHMLLPPLFAFLGNFMYMDVIFHTNYGQQRHFVEALVS